MSIYQSTKVSPYVYWLTHKTTGQFYIGYREANKVPSDQDLPIYKSSSDKIDELGFENFNFQIIAEFFDGDSAYDFENRTIEANIKNPLCLNKHFLKEGQLRWRMKGSHSAESKEKNRISHLGSNNASYGTHPTMELIERRRISLNKTIASRNGSHQSKEAREKNRISHLGKIHSTESKHKISVASSGENNGNYGNKASIETRKKMSDIRKSKPKIECPHCKKICAEPQAKRSHLDRCKFKIEN